VIARPGCVKKHPAAPPPARVKWFSAFIMIDDRSKEYVDNDRADEPAYGLRDRIGDQQDVRSYRKELVS
jgi:hypothetical protein